MICVTELFVLAGPTFGAVCYVSGTRQGQTVLYRENSYPFHALGEVTFLWRPVSTASESTDSAMLKRQLWIWTHPACYADIFTELKKVFHLSEADCRSVPVSSDSGVHYSDTETTSGVKKQKKRKKKRVEDAVNRKRPKLKDNSAVEVTAASEGRTEHSVVSPDTAISYCKPDEQLTGVTAAPSVATSVSEINIEVINADMKGSNNMKSTTTAQCGTAHLLSKTELIRNIYENSEVRLESLKDELCRFRLIGPKSHQVIVEAVRLAEASCVNGSVTVVDSMDERHQLSAEVQKRWWDVYIATEHGLTESEQQASSWKKVSKVQNAAELPPSSVHGMTVRDPRLFLPQRRSSVSYSMCGECSR